MVTTADMIQKLEALCKEAQDVVRGFVAAQNEFPVLEEIKPTGAYRAQVNTLSLAVDAMQGWVEDRKEEIEEGTLVLEETSNA